MKSGEYKSFSRAAQEVGLDKDERKLAAMDPSILLEGLSDEIKESLKPEMLVAFFNTLQGQEANQRLILDLGNLLYRYRNDVATSERKDILSLNEKDWQLLSLAYRLLEGAFYSAKMYDLKKEQAAALAFTVNVMAKILEQTSAENLAGVDAERLEEFVGSVHEYEQQTLFPAPEGEAGALSRQEAIAQLGKKIESQMKELDEFDRSINWGQYFNELANTLRLALNTIENEDVFGHRYLTVRYLIDDTWNEIPEALAFCREEKMRLEQRVKQGLYEPAQSTLRYSIAGYGLIGPTKEYSNGRNIDDFTTDEHMYKLLCKDYVSESSPKESVRTPQRIRGFGQLGEVTKPERMKKAVDAISQVFDGKKCSGPLIEYERKAREINNLMNKRRKILIQDDQFSQSEQRIKSRSTNPAALMYLIKSQLIVDNILQSWSDPSNRASAEYNLSTRSYPYEFKKEKGPNVHIFIPGEYDPYYDVKRGPAYASLHFLPEEIPFAVWTSRYLKSKKVA